MDNASTKKKKERKSMGSLKYINKVIHGDCLEVMRNFPDESIDMCFTSPPYWGLRDYGVEQIFGGDKDCEHEWDLKSNSKNMSISDKSTLAGFSSDNIQVRNLKIENQQGYCKKCGAWKGQLGLEPTPEMYVQHMTGVFHEVKRALKKTGTLWVVIGDTYSGSNCGSNDYREETGLGTAPQIRYKGQKPGKTSFPSKCLVMIPERLVLSLIQDGWILRNKIIWHKPNGMPSSVRDRFSNKWEYILMFSKNNKTVLWQHKKTRKWVDKEPLGTKGKEGEDWEWKAYKWKEDKKVSLWQGFTYFFDLAAVREPHKFDTAQAKRDLERMEKGRHVYKGKRVNSGYQKSFVAGHSSGKNPGDIFEINTQPFPEAHFAVFPEKLCEKPIKAGCPEGGILLDPFCGSGTALLVAQGIKRNFIGIDISEKYCEMARERVVQGVL